LNDTTIVINELPVGTWTKEYREYLETLLSGSPLAKKTYIKNIRDEYNDIDVKITIEFIPGILDKLTKQGKLMKELKLESSVHLTNMWLYDATGRLKRYTSPDEILEEYMETRQKVYEDRRLYRIKELTHDHALLSAKAEFIQAVCEDRVDVRGKDEELVKAFKNLKLPELTEHSVSTTDMLAGWKYLMTMPIRSLTEQKRLQLLAERDDIMTKIKRLQESTSTSLWLDDLTVFEKSYAEFLKERLDCDAELRMESSSSTEKTSNVRSRTTTSKTSITNKPRKLARKITLNN